MTLVIQAERARAQAITAAFARQPLGGALFTQWCPSKGERPMPGFGSSGVKHCDLRPDPSASSCMCREFRAHGPGAPSYRAPFDTGRQAQAL